MRTCEELVWYGWLEKEQTEQKKKLAAFALAAGRGRRGAPPGKEKKASSD